VKSAALLDLIRAQHLFPQGATEIWTKSLHIHVPKRSGNKRFSARRNKCAPTDPLQPSWAKYKATTGATISIVDKKILRMLNYRKRVKRWFKWIPLKAPAAR